MEADVNVDRAVSRRRFDDSAAPGGGTPSVARDFRRVADMTPRQMEDIVAFLRSLTDEQFDRTEPGSVPSGLPPGGRIFPGSF